MILKKLLAMLNMCPVSYEKQYRR